MAPPHRRRRRNSVPAIDRLSALPDSVLTHLLSFLATKECVATSILSKRWSFIWQYVPVLDLSRQNQDTVSRVVSLHKVQRLDAFRLHFDNRKSTRDIEAWLIAAIDRNVRKLDFAVYRMFVLPSCLFTCESLVDLTLTWCAVFPTNLTDVSLPRLKYLCLHSILFQASESLTCLISGCPVLEELQIRWVIYGDLVRFIISSPTIKRLVFILKLNCTIQLNTPALEDLHIDDGLTVQIESGPLPSLIKARLTFSYSSEDVEDPYRCYRSALNFVNKLSDVQCLDISLACYIKDEDMDIDLLLAAWSTVSFNNLTRLKLAAPNRFLPKFLEMANNLDFLYFSEFDSHMQPDDWIDPQGVPTCLLSSLRTITIGARYQLTNELEMIRYLLKNALVLETMEIAFSGCEFESDSYIEAAVDGISLYERGSNTCELRFI